MLRRVSVIVLSVASLTAAGAEGAVAASGVRSAPTIAASGASGGGQLDSTIGTGGLTLSPSADGAFVYAESAADDDGGLYAAGVTTAGGVTIVHYSSPGAIDSTFAPVSLPAPDGSKDDTSVQVAVDSSDRLYTVVSTPDGSTLTRLTAAGAVDTTFGTSGSVKLPAAYDYIEGLAVASGDVYVAGEDDTDSLNSVLAYTTSGAKDTAFASNGTLSLSSDVVDIELALAGSDLYVGTTAATSDDDVAALSRYSTAGVRDTSFAPALPSGADLDGVAVDSAGLVYAELDTSAGVVVDRWTAAGAQDSSFGTAGTADVPGTAAELDPDWSQFGGGLVVAADGSVYADTVQDYQTAGSGTGTGDGDDDTDSLSRLLSNGSVDSSFGTNGSAVLQGTQAHPISEDSGVGFTLIGAEPTLLSDGSIAVSAVTGSQIAVGQLTTTTSRATYVADGHRLADSRASSTGLARLDGETVPFGAVTGVALTTVAADVPSDATSVLLDVSVVSPTTSGYVRVTSGYGLPETTAVNFSKGVSQTVLVSTPVAADGSIELEVSGKSELVVDQLGYEDQHDPSGGKSFTAITPTRALDTRSGLGASKGQKNGLFTVTLPSSVPVGATPVLNVTAVAPKAAGFLQLDAHGGTPVTAVNYAAGQSATGLALTGVDSSRRIDVTTHGSTDVVIDVVGYFAASDSSDGPGAFVAVPPSRIVDSRSGTGVSAGVKSGAVTFTVPTSLVPAGAAGVLLNISPITPSGMSYVTLKATGASSSSTILNVTKGQSLTALSITSLSSGNQATLTLAGFSANVVVDVVGYYASAPSA